ncbi:MULTISPECIES: hypothetical protein [unclassified Marinovum]
MFVEQNTVAKFTGCNLAFGTRQNTARKDASLSQLATGIRLKGDSNLQDLLTDLLSTDEGAIHGKLSSLQGVGLSEPATFHVRGRHRLGLPMLGISVESSLTPLRAHVIFRDLDEANYGSLYPFRGVVSEEIFAAECYSYLMLRALSDVNLDAVLTVADIKTEGEIWRRFDCLLIEDFASAALNRRGHLSHDGDPSFEATDVFNFFLFQCLVGNSDYHFDFSDRGRLQLHNTLLISSEGRQIPVPYDFQYVCTVAPEYWKFGPGDEAHIARRNAEMLYRMMETMPQIDFLFCFEAIDFAHSFLGSVEMTESIRLRHKTYLNALSNELELFMEGKDACN